MTTQPERERYSQACANQLCKHRCDRGSAHCRECRSHLRAVLGMEPTSAPQAAVYVAYRVVAAEREADRLLALERHYVVDMLNAYGAYGRLPNTATLRATEDLLIQATDMRRLADKHQREVNRHMDGPPIEATFVAPEPQFVEDDPTGPIRRVMRYVCTLCSRVAVHPSTRRCDSCGGAVWLDEVA